MYSILLNLHLGLGDHIMCHGIVREYCKKYDQVTIFSKPHDYASVAFMYRDLKNLGIIKGDDVFARAYVAHHGSEYTEVKTIGYEKLNRTSGVPLEKQYYALAGIDFSKKWSSFFVERDYSREHALYERLAPRGAYVFLHEDRERHYAIKRKQIDGKYEVIEAEKRLTENVFDYCTLIERAQEIHVIDSAFMFLIDCLQYDAPGQKLFVHRYARANYEWTLPILKKNWTILGTSTPGFTRRLVNLLQRKTHKLIAKRRP